VSLLDTQEGRDTVLWSIRDGMKPRFGCECIECEARAAVLDPAKLAELMAEALRERGLWSRADVWHEGAYSSELGRVIKTRAHYVVIADEPSNAEEHEEYQCISDICEHYAVDIDNKTMPQARAALLRVLSLPKGATAADAVKAVETP
jgi:hypothetical protein